MRKRLPWIAFVVVLLAFSFSCAIPIVRRNHDGGLGRFDLGDGRVVEVWWEPRFGDPAVVYAEVQLHGRPLCKPIYLGPYHPEYRVRTVWLKDRPVSVIYAVGDGPGFAVYVDWASLRVWPGRDEEYPVWRELFQRFREQHPDMRVDSAFEGK